MTEPKFTRGPWTYEVDLSRPYIPGSFCDFNLRKGEVDIVIGCGCYGSPLGDNKHDLPLIAAAPDMYAALQSAEQSIVDFIGITGIDRDSGAHDVLHEVRTALAKARGETQEQPK